MALNIVRIANLEDPRLDVYRDLKKTNQTRWSSRFVAEGRLVVERLLESDFGLDSVLVSEARLHRIEDRLRSDVPCYLVSHEDCSKLVGFHFHAGLMAAGIRRPRNTFAVAPEKEEQEITLAACPQISMPDNLGSIIRLAAAFRLDGVIVGPMSADPFSRRVVRVSMGNIFGLPIIQPDNFETELQRLAGELQFEIVGTSRNPDAVGLRNFRRKRRTIVVFGNEAEGLRPEWIQLCHRQLTIEMSQTVDSLNVATAAAVVLYHLAEFS